MEDIRVGIMRELETREQVITKLTEATQNLPAMVKKIENKDGVKNLPCEEVRNISEEMIHEMVEIINDLKRYAVNELGDFDLAQDLSARGSSLCDMLTRIALNAPMKKPDNLPSKQNPKNMFDHMY